MSGQGICGFDVGIMIDRMGVAIHKKYGLELTVSTDDSGNSARHYYLPIYSKSSGYNVDWLKLSGGLASTPMTTEKLKAILLKAQSGNYDTIVLPDNAPQHPQFEHLLNEIKRFGFRVRIQLLVSGLPFSLSAMNNYKAYLDFDFVLDDIPDDISGLEAKVSSVNTRIILPGIKTAPVWKKLKNIPHAWYRKLYFYFPYYGAKKMIFKPRQIRDIFLLLKRWNSEFVPKMIKGLDVFEPRIDQHADLESLVRPVLQTPLREQVKVSVVIPAYNNGNYVINTLRHLSAQVCQRNAFEVVLVDDGSSDNTSELILNQRQQFLFPFTYIYYPRFKKRQMGDSQFRAGLARNLGVKWARGELLAFLDADIIVPQNYIQSVIDLHHTHQVVQWRREYLKKEVPSFEIKYSDVVLQKDCFVPEGGYWKQFYDLAQVKGWHNLPDYWKYTCTYALSLKKDLFKEVGWFRKTYCFYGFEDTDLGLQLMRYGARFYFHNEPVYHLYHETTRSEFRNSFFHRQRLLKNTARIFYHNTLDPEVFRVFKYLLSPFF